MLLNSYCQQLFFSILKKLNVILVEIKPFLKNFKAANMKLLKVKSNLNKGLKQMLQISIVII